MEVGRVQFPRGAVKMKATCVAFACFAGIAGTLSAEPIRLGVLPSPIREPKERWLANRLDASSWAGKICEFEVIAKGETGVTLRLFIETGSQVTPLRMRLRDGVERMSRVVAKIPENVDELNLRVDYQEGGGRAEIVRCRFGLADEFEDYPRNAPKDPDGIPQLMFRAGFDGNAEGAGGRDGNRRVLPILSNELSFEAGLKGKAVRLGPRSALAYPFDGNVRAVRGTVAFWARADKIHVKETLTRSASLFAFPMSDLDWGRLGTGAVLCWYNHWSGVNALLSDIEDRQVGRYWRLDDKWHAYAMTWDVDEGVKLWIDGRKCEISPYEESPIGAVHRLSDRKPFIRQPTFDRFFVGSVASADAKDVKYRFHGLIDELQIWDRPLTDAAIEAKSRELAAACRKSNDDNATDWKNVFASPNAYSKPLASGARPGVPDDLKLIEEVAFDKLPVNGTRVRVCGNCRIRELNGTNYLELDPKSRAGRFAYRFKLDRNVPFYVFEVDYPDDKARTADICVCDAQKWDNDYSLQTGYITGDEYRSGGQMGTIRYVYWTSGEDVAFVLMTARQDQPAAVAKIRVYASASGRLPTMGVSEPTPVNGWRRSIGFYWEDPAIGYDFGLRETQGATVEDYRKIVDRTVAYMKYTGLNFFAYPVSWYGGLIGVDRAQRPHAPDFVQAWYTRFDEEGLSFMPIINTHEMNIDPDLLTYRKARDGSLLNTEVNIMGDTGLPPGGGTHGTPPAWCFFHPKVQANITRILDRLLEDGAPHPSFKGIALHLTYHPFLHWGDEKAGYNDYCIAAFLKRMKAWGEDDRIKPLSTINGNDPMRARKYYEALKANPELWKEWLHWRCDVLVDFYADFAAKMRRRRPDLKLWFNSMITMNTWNFSHPKYGTPDWVEYQALGAGFDAAKISSRIPNAIVGQTSVPADYRWRYVERIRNPENDRLAAYQRGLELSEGLWRACAKSSFPFAHQHDRYWEDPVGKMAPSFWFGRCCWEPDDYKKCVLSGDWLKETEWRVSTINPAGRNALRSFVAPLIHSDVLGLTKGGFLFGFYGEEEVLAPWAREFRKLPAVKLPTLRSATVQDPVLVRGGKVDGKTYVYLLNTSDCPRTTSWDVDGRFRTIRLDSYELRTFSWVER